MHSVYKFNYNFHKYIITTMEHLFTSNTLTVTKLIVLNEIKFTTWNGTSRSKFHYLYIQMRILLSTP